MALSTTALPEVRAVMSKPSRIGTPLEISVPSVRVKRATAILRISIPISGSFNRMVSIAYVLAACRTTISGQHAADDEHDDQ